MTYEERVQASVPDRIIKFSYEGCEYLLLDGKRLTHKGNCSNPIHCFNKIEN